MQNLAKQRLGVGHPNKLVVKFDQFLADKNLANKLKNAKSSLPSINPEFQKRLDDRRKKLVNSSSGIQQDQDLSIINTNLPENYRHQTSIPKERDGSCIKIVKSAKRLGSVERENDEPVRKLRQNGNMGLPPSGKNKLGASKLGGDFDVLDWINRAQTISRGSKLPSAGELSSPKGPVNHFPRRNELPPLPLKDYILSGSQNTESNLPPVLNSKRSEAVKTPEIQQLRFSLDGRLAAKAPSRRYCADISTDHGEHEDDHNETVRNIGCRVSAVLETVEDDSPVLPAKRMSLLASEFKIVARGIETLEDELPITQVVQAEEDDEVTLY